MEAIRTCADKIKRAARRLAFVFVENRLFLQVVDMKELFISNSLEKANAVGDRLRAQGIQYSLRTVDSASAGLFSATSRRSRGAFGEKSGLSKLYYIHVKRKDYNIAKELV